MKLFTFDLFDPATRTLRTVEFEATSLSDAVINAELLHPGCYYPFTKTDTQ